MSDASFIIEWQNYLILWQPMLVDISMPKPAKRLSRPAMEQEPIIMWPQAKGHSTSTLLVASVEVGVK